MDTWGVCDAPGFQEQCRGFATKAVDKTTVPLPCFSSLLLLSSLTSCPEVTGVWLWLGGFPPPTPFLTLEGFRWQANLISGQGEGCGPGNMVVPCLTLISVTLLLTSLHNVCLPGIYKKGIKRKVNGFLWHLSFPCHFLPPPHYGTWTEQENMINNMKNKSD